MTVFNTADAAPVAPHPVEDVYRLHYDLLLHISMKKFGVPSHDAESLIQEVFLSYIGSASEVHNARSWLIGAVCNASRYYWRSHTRNEALPEDYESHGDPHSHGIDDRVATQITMRETISRLHEKCQKTLRLRYWDGCSAAEVAQAFDTTNRYAEKLIHKCLKRAHEIYKKLNGVGRA